MLEKSEILFLYESVYSIPNGDPFTGEQRYDEETKKILISDVRIKRFIRDYFLEQNVLSGTDQYEIYVWNDLVESDGKESASSARMKKLKKKFSNDKKNKIIAKDLLCKCIDVRLFGGISTEKSDTVHLTGPVQFALLNPSLNKVDMRIHQNTSVFASSTEKKQGAIGTTTVVPYSLNQIHGWLNPFSAKHTNLARQDVDLMFQALWESINNANTRSKSNQNSLLLLEVVYSKPTYKLYRLDQLIKISSDKTEEQVRSLDELQLDFSALEQTVSSDKVAKIRYYSEHEQISNQLNAILGSKAEALNIGVEK